MVLGMTSVFVPEDLLYLQATASQIASINPHLVPLIAHDRAGFGGGLDCVEVMVALIALHAKPSRHVWQALLFAGTIGFLCAISVHICIGYLVPVHDSTRNHGSDYLSHRHGNDLSRLPRHCGRTMNEVVPDHLSRANLIWTTLAHRTIRP